MRSLIVSVHDFSPKYLGELRDIFEELTFQGIRRSILVIPNLYSRYSVSRFGDAVDLLWREKEVGSEILLHGYHHTEEGIYREFKDISFEEAKGKLESGRIVMSELEIEVSGFVPPYYKISKEAEHAVKASGFDFIVKNPEIIDWKNNHTYLSRPLSYWPYNRLIDLGFRMHNEFQLDFELSKNDLIRVDVHPQDLWKAKPFYHALGIIERTRQDRSLTSFRDYLKAKKP